MYLSWKVQYLVPSFSKNSNAALRRLLAFTMLFEPSSHGRQRVGKPNGSAPYSCRENYDTCIFDVGFDKKKP